MRGTSGGAPRGTGAPPSSWLLAPALRHRFLISIADVVPIHHAPECFDILRTAVLMLQVVGMFPNIDAEQRHLMLRYRAVLVRARGDFELFPIQDQPTPAAAENFRGGFRELLFEFVVAGELFIDSGR